MLIVDDNATNRTILKAQITAWQMSPDVAADGAAALDMLRRAVATGQPYAVAVLDLRMPDMDGRELARQISADPALATTRLLLLTSSMRPGGTPAERPAGQTWLSKPASHSELFDRLMQVLADEPTNVTAIPAPRALKAAAQQTRGRVLVAEDNHLNQLVARGMVTKLGYSVDVVGNGVEALETMNERSHSAVLMNCHMPEMDGYQATAEIRRREGTGRRTPIIAMTAGATTEDRDRCLAAGMDDFISKPVAVSIIDAVLARWMNGNAVAAASPPAEAGNRTPAPASIDTDRLDALRQLGPDDGWGLFPTVIAAFLEDGPTQLANLGQAIARDDGLALEKGAHELKGAAANVGATAVCDLCRQLEAVGRSGLPNARAGDLLDQLAGELDRTMEPLTNALPSAR